MDHSEARELAPERQRRRKAVVHISDAVTDADQAFVQGELERMTTATLRTHLLTLANQPANQVRERDVIRSLVLNNLLLQRQIDRMGRRHAFHRWLVGALAFSALVGSIVDITLSVTREPVRIQVSQPAGLQSSTELSAGAKQ